eukprot:TRINITY_DN12614_c0_g1_i4.p1 TRINITY_DN12614_c0_g1~~TRINITY_DN12614_c0_g1_i4.p1  ORF type:complete len:118 (+),score=4.61 TRINITY_DN12614_c0_g1_i4:135-488(+)
METRVPKNPKYSHIKSTLKTGKTIKDTEVLSDKLIAKRKNEPFKRIKPSTLAKLLNVRLLTYGRSKTSRRRVCMRWESSRRTWMWRRRALSRPLPFSLPLPLPLRSSDSPFAFAYER